MLLLVSSLPLSLIPPSLRVLRVLPTAENVTIEASSSLPVAECPSCGSSSRRLHSNYVRKLRDLPSHGQAVMIQLSARRFRCLNLACGRKTFAERLGDAVSVPSLRNVTGGSSSARQIASQLMTGDTLPEVELDFVASLLKQVPELAECIAAAKRLTGVLCKKGKETLEKVLEDAGKTALGSFVANLRSDIGAVQAALELPWTTSPAEGQINRLKMLKRTMYGRAGFGLLRARVLHAT